jgi:hypothetical protein
MSAITHQPGRLAQAVQGNWYSAGTQDLTTGSTDYTWGNIPEAAFMIKVAIAGASLSVDEEMMIRIGDEDGIDTSGYIGAVESNDFTQLKFSITLGFQISLGQDAGHAYHGSVDLTRVGSLTWVEHGMTGFDSGNGGGEGPAYSIGSLTLGKPLTQVQLLSADGSGADTNTFDAGVAELYYFV